MPTVSTTMYLTDEVYKEKYLPRKKEILETMRNTIREQLGIAKDKNEN